MSHNWQQGNYLSLSTQKRDGSWVNTPVWFAYDQEREALFCFSESKAGKVKRIRNFSAVKINPCTVTGTLQGEWQDADAELLKGKQDIIYAHDALIKSYGWQMRLLNIFSKLAGKIEHRTFICIRLK
ncbi:MAG: PPOX class F420-dependent oxidoreductase [Pseudomonadales bacterium]|nr:PPOX class F420-dependent oxidoreductase [Pseudomonadales bacterium]